MRRAAAHALGSSSDFAHRGPQSGGESAWGRLQVGSKDLLEGGAPDFGWIGLDRRRKTSGRSLKFRSAFCCRRRRTICPVVKEQPLRSTHLRSAFLFCRCAFTCESIVPSHLLTLQSVLSLPIQANIAPQASQFQPHTTTMKTSSVGILALAIVACVCLSSHANAEVSARNRLKGAGRPKSGSNWAPGTSWGRSEHPHPLPTPLRLPSAEILGRGGEENHDGFFKLGASVWTPASDRRPHPHPHQSQTEHGGHGKALQGESA